MSAGFVWEGRETCDESSFRVVSIPPAQKSQFKEEKKVHLAVLVTGGQGYTGAKGDIMVWNPYVESDDEYIISHISLKNGPSFDSLSAYEAVEAGWSRRQSIVFNTNFDLSLPPCSSSIPSLIVIISNSIDLPNSSVEALSLRIARCAKQLKVNTSIIGVGLRFIFHISSNSKKVKPWSWTPDGEIERDSRDNWRRGKERKRGFSEGEDSGARCHIGLMDNELKNVVQCNIHNSYEDDLAKMKIDIASDRPKMNGPRPMSFFPFGLAVGLYFDGTDGVNSLAVLVTGGQRYTGAKGDIIVWKPNVESDDAYSISHISLKNGPSFDSPSAYEAVEAGWAFISLLLVFSSTSRTMFLLFGGMAGERPMRDYVACSICFSYYHTTQACPASFSQCEQPMAYTSSVDPYWQPTSEPYYQSYTHELSNHPDFSWSQDQPPAYQNHQVMELPNLSPQSWAYQAQCPTTSSAYSSPYETTYEMVPQTPSINPPPPYKPSLEEILTNYLNRQEESTQLGTDTSYDYSHSLGASKAFFTKPPFIDPHQQQGSSLEEHLLQFISRCEATTQSLQNIEKRLEKYETEQKEYCFQNPGIENPIPDSIESNYEDGSLFDPKPLVDFPIDPLKVDTCEPQEVDPSVVFPQDSLVLDQSDQIDPISPFQPVEIVDLFVDSSEMPLVVDPSEIQEPEIRGPIQSNNDIKLSNDVDVLLDHVANKAQVDHLLLDDSKSNDDLNLASQKKSKQSKCYNEEPLPHVSLSIVPCYQNICVGQINYVDLDLVVETYPKCTSLTTVSRDAPRSLEYANVFTGDDSPITCLVVPLNDTLTFDPWPPPFKCSPVSSYPSHNDCSYSVEMFPAGIEAFLESRIGHAPLIIDFCAILDFNHESNLSHDLMVAISADQPPDIWFALSHYLRLVDEGRSERRLVDRTVAMLVIQVSITPEVISKKVCRDIVEALSKSHLAKHQLSYDGNKNIYTAGPLPFESHELVIKLPDKRREREFKVAVKFVAKGDNHHLQGFLQSRHLDAPQETIHALDVVLRTIPSAKYQVLGRSFFYPTFGKGQLGDGLEYWKGYYQSLRPTQMGLSLNIDLASARPFSDQERIQDNVKEAKSKRKSGEVSSNTTENDKFSEVFGKDQMGHVRGVGSHRFYYGKLKFRVEVIFDS
ncbi:hypothetical protein LguiB_005528 [Lonicera macranthoides]